MQRFLRHALTGAAIAVFYLEAIYWRTVKSGALQSPLKAELPF